LLSFADIKVNTVNMSTAGTYTFNVSTVFGPDNNPGNDNLTPVMISKALLVLTSVSASPASYCISGGKPVLNSSDVSGYGRLQWQQFRRAAEMTT
jgi:hypothetical protein